MQNAANLATVIASVIAAFSMGAGFFQFYETQKLTRHALELQLSALRSDQEMKAVELFLRFNEVQEELADEPLPKRTDAAFWRHNALLVNTETVFRLTEGDSGWTETIDWMLEVQAPFLIQNEFRCKSFAAAFLIRMRNAAPSLKCLPDKN